MSAPTLEQLPKVAADLKTQLEGFAPAQLKNAQTTEKTALPTKEDIASEKKHQNLVQGIEGFDKKVMKSTETKEKVTLPDREDIAAEKGQQALRAGIEGFNASALKKTETQEKIHSLLKKLSTRRNLHRFFLSMLKK